jgi:two-component system cell cycle sensor histidine kinase/response regulator CckA
MVAGPRVSLQSPSRTNAPDRLAAVRRTALLDTPPEESFDRLTRMAARLLGAPVALISLVTDDRQFFKSATGLPEPWATRRGTPLAYSICRHVVETGASLVVDDVRRHPLLRSNLAARELGWIAYAGVPLVTGQGFAVGALSVIDAVPRLWSERDLALLQDLAACAVTEIELHSLRGRVPAEPAPRSGNGAIAPAGGFDAAGIPMGVVSADGRWLRVNRPLIDLLGYPEDELLGAPAERITHPADREADREALALLLAGECDSYSGEKRCLKRSAEVAWVLATVTAVPAGGGKPRQLVVGFQDITDRKAVEAALREREERYRLAAGAASDAVRDWNLATDRVTWGDGQEPVFGWPPPAAANPGWWYQRIHPDDRERVVGAIQSAITRGDRAWEIEYRFRRADGSWARVADRGLVVTENGEPVRLVGAMADVGERLEAVEALRRSEARYRSVVDDLREVVFQTDLAGRWVLLNPAWQELTGFDVGESIGTPFLDYVHPDDRARNAREVAPLLARRKSSSRYEVRYLTRDGAFRWVEVQARLTLDERGEPTGTTGTLSDQTERKRAELLSIGQSRLLEEIASGAALGRVLDGIVRFAEEHATPSIATLMLLRPETGELTLASAPRLPESVRQALGVVPVGPQHGSCGTAVHRRERVVSRDIATDPLWEGWPQREMVLAAGIRSSWSVPIVSVTGEVLGTFAIYHLQPREPAIEDLRIVEIATHLAAIAIERERTQEAVRRSSMLLEQVLESLPVGVWVLAEDGRLVFGNRAGQEIWGGARYVPLEELGEYRGWWVETGEPIAAGEWAAARAIRDGQTSLNELVRIATFDGRERIILNSAVPVRGPEGAVVGAILVQQDISERHAAEEALRRSEQQLRQAQKMEAVGQLAGGIAHDFNNLLTGILSYCDLILQEVRGGDPIRADLEQIRHAGLRAAGLTRQLLAFSRRQVLQPRVLALNSTVAELDGMLRRLLAADIMLESELDPALGYVMADPDQIEQVLVHLVVNARDAMPRGGRVRIATANVRLPAEGEQRPDGVRPGAYVALSVTDTGVGMDLETQARVFEPFFTTKEPGKGTGLGLSTVYGIVQQSGGHVTVRSAPGQGATFTVYLPRHDGPAAALPARTDRRTLPGGAETLLLVEDEAAVRSSARRLLERYGYTVLEARHGADALRLVEEGGPEIDLVLTDLVMPEMGGQELVERLRARRPTLKVLYMSGYTEKAITTDGLMPPRTGFVEKPFTVEQLLRRLREVLDE